MKLNKRAEILQGCKEVYTHIVFAAHQDDVEIMCGDGIVQCYNNPEKGLVVVIASDGAGSPRNGKFANFTNEEMIKERRKEQIKAAEIGKYAKLIFLNYPSREIKSDECNVSSDIVEIMKEFSPTVVYTHNPADKHRTHTSLLKCVLKGLRMLPMDRRPKKFYGCECWRNLDWLNDDEKVVFNLTGHQKLLREVLEVYKSQIDGGKRYDLATEGRRLANATFYRSHNVDVLSLASFGMDLTSLILDDEIDLKKFTLDKIERFKKEILL